MQGYREMIDCEMPDILCMLSQVPHDTYGFVSRSCLAAFCVGARYGSSFSILTKSKNGNVAQQLIYKFCKLGDNVEKATPEHNDDILHALELSNAIEAVADDLGCKEYCWKAMEKAGLVPNLDSDLN